MIYGLLDSETYFYFNEYKDEVEINVYYYQDGIVVNAMLCDDQLPFRDYVGLGKHPKSRKIAIRKAIKNLNQQAYQQLSSKSV